MKILFECNTPFQVITALNIYHSFFSKDTVTFVLSDYFNGSRELAKKIKASCAIKNVYAVETIEKVRNGNNVIYQSFITPQKLIDSFDVLDDYNYDMFFFNNYDMLSAVIYEKVYSCNCGVICNRYEEGYSSYFDNFDQQKSCKIFEQLERLRGKPSLSYSVNNFWYYVPEFAQYKHKKSDILHKIPILNRNDYEFVNMLNSIWWIKTIDRNFETKFIFFEDAFAYNGDDINDVEIVNEITNVVGSDNLTIKLHPRSNVNRFSKLGAKINLNIGVPWELFQINSNFDGKVFLTVASGSVLASKVYFSDKVKIVYLYKCTNHKPKYVTEEFEKHIHKVMTKFGAENVYIPKNTNELLSIIKQF